MNTTGLELFYRLRFDTLKLENTMGTAKYAKHAKKMQKIRSRAKVVGFIASRLSCEFSLTGVKILREISREKAQKTGERQSILCFPVTTRQ